MRFARSARLGILLFFAALVCSRTSHGTVLRTAFFSANAQARDNAAVTNEKPEDQVATLKGNSLVAGRSPLNFSGTVSANHGDSVAQIFGHAHAEVGSIGVGFGGRASSPPPIPDVIKSGGEARVNGARAEARWLEFVTPKVRSVPLGQLLTLRTIILLDGRMSASLSNNRGSAHARVDFIEDSFNSTVFPNPGTEIDGFLDEEPTNNRHVLKNAPSIFLVTHRMTNGFPYHFDTGIVVRCDASSNEGGVSSIEANYSATLKWGGIESITDQSGNPIAREDWTIESESGFDYSRSFDEQQVPEPSGAIMLRLGLSMLARSWRRLDGK